MDKTFFVKDKLKPALFIKELTFFLSAIALGLFVAVKLSVVERLSPMAVEPLVFSSIDFITLALFFGVFSFIMLRYRRLAGVILKLFFLIVIFVGSNIVFESFLAFPHSLILSLFVVATMFIGASIFTHNLAVLLGIAGLSAVFGLSIRPSSAALLLGFLAIYDVIAVYKTKHMVALAENMIVSGAIFGFIVPLKWEYFFTDVRSARVGRQIMILGSGDIGLPIVFASSLVPVSLSAAIIVAVSSVIGLFITHVLFVSQTERKPMAALPPIATMSILGYLIYTLI